MVNIYLNIDGGQVLALAIPLSDIQRLSLRPLKWLRYVTFTICGVHGDLSEALGGPAIDYDTISLDDSIAEDYYFTPQGEYCLIDYAALNDRISSSSQMPHYPRFRSDIIERDQFCVFTRQDAGNCIAAHLIPHSKGDKYIEAVINDRLHLYDPAPELQDLGIDSIQNGILLRNDLHSKFEHGQVAFLKTPNFVLDPADIPKVEEGPMPCNRMTLQHLEQPVGLFPIPGVDAHFSGTGVSPPPSIILDYLYGVAAFQRWGGGRDMTHVMQQRHQERFESIPLPAAFPPSVDDDGHESPVSDRSDPSDPTYHPPKERHHRSKMSTEMLDAMDDILFLSRLIKGHTPQVIAAEQQRQAKERMLHAKEASQAKVQQWMQAVLD